VPNPDPTSPEPANPATDHTRAGLAFALAAYAFWGVAAFYFRAVGHVSPFEILAHRVVWAAALLWTVLAATRRLREARVTGRSVRTLGNLLLSGLLVAVNWLCFVYAIDVGRLTEASLGYFINPLVSVGLGMVFLSERLRPLQWAAVGFALAGVAAQTVLVGRLPWISLTLAFSFGLYGLVRKQSTVGPVMGLAFETLLLLPAALAFLALTEALGWTLGRERTGTAFLNTDVRTALLLVAAGGVTAFPLVCFTAAAKRLRLTTIGFMQYVAPTLQLAVAVLAFGEAFPPEQAVVFGLIWTGIAVFIFDSVRIERAKRTPGPASVERS